MDKRIKLCIKNSSFPTGKGITKPGDKKLKLNDRGSYNEKAVSLMFSPVLLLSHVRLFDTSWTARCQASLSLTNSRSFLKNISIESEIPSNHLILLSSTPSPALSLSQHLGLLSCTLYQAYYRLVPTAGISVMRLSKISKQSCKICYHILQIWNLSLSKRG